MHVYSPVAFHIVLRSLMQPLLIMPPYRAPSPHHPQVLSPRERVKLWGRVEEMLAGRLPPPPPAPGSPRALASVLHQAAAATPCRHPRYGSTAPPAPAGTPAAAMTAVVRPHLGAPYTISPVRGASPGGAFGGGGGGGGEVACAVMDTTISQVGVEEGVALCAQSFTGRAV